MIGEYVDARFCVDYITGSVVEHDDSRVCRRTFLCRLYNWFCCRAPRSESLMTASRRQCSGMRSGRTITVTHVSTTRCTLCRCLCCVSTLLTTPSLHTMVGCLATQEMIYVAKIHVFVLAYCLIVPVLNNM